MIQLCANFLVQSWVIYFGTEEVHYNGVKNQKLYFESQLILKRSKCTYVELLMYDMYIQNILIHISICDPEVELPFVFVHEIFFYI